MTITAVALADPYGPPYAVTDMAPFCARCHASTALTQLIDLPQSAAAADSVEAKHLARIRKDDAYKDLSATDREALINAINWMDEQSSVVIKEHITGTDNKHQQERGVRTGVREK